MRNQKIIIALLFIMAAAACQKVIDIPVSVNDGRLYLECVPSNDADTTYIRLMAAVPISSSGASRGLKNVKIDFRVNGTRMEAGLKSDDNYFYTFYVPGRLSTGDKVSIGVMADGYPPISASSTVPKGPEFELTRENISNAKLVHKLKIHRNAGESWRYCGVCILAVRTEKTVYTDPSKKTVLEERMVPVTFYDLKPGYVHITASGRDMILFELGLASSDVTEAQIAIGYANDDRTSMGPEYKTTYFTRYNIEVYAIDNQAYRYLNPETSYVLLSAGLLPPFSSSFNVAGGYGIAGCIGKSESGWLPNLDTARSDGSSAGR